jgi:hypothetical protein
MYGPRAALPPFLASEKYSAGDYVHACGTWTTWGVLKSLSPDPRMRTTSALCGSSAGGRRRRCRMSGMLYILRARFPSPGVQKKCSSDYCGFRSITAYRQGDPAPGERLAYRAIQPSR